MLDMANDITSFCTSYFSSNPLVGQFEGEDRWIKTVSEMFLIHFSGIVNYLPWPREWSQQTQRRCRYLCLKCSWWFWRVAPFSYCHNERPKPIYSLKGNRNILAFFPFLPSLETINSPDSENAIPSGCLKRSLSNLSALLNPPSNP